MVENKEKVSKQSIKTYKILSISLRYPDENLKMFSGEFYSILRDEGILEESYIDSLAKLFTYFKETRLLTLQENYVALFDRQKSFSLYLFEHVHGDSRDRGQALVDLKNVYTASDLQMITNELPDYIPLFLEYLSLLSVDEANSFLSEPINIIATVGRRLQNCGSIYSCVFSALVSLAKIKPDEKVLDNVVKSKRGFKITTDDSFVGDEWEEKPAFVK